MTSRFASAAGQRFRDGLRVTFFYAVPAACLTHTIFDYCGEISPSMGPSMLPTLSMMGDLLMVERLPGWRHRLKVGDLVTFYSPISPERRAVKRLLGFEGDTVCVDPTKDTLSYVQIPKGHVWLQGDNYSNSTDSRVYGPIPLALLRGRVLARVYPSPRLLTNGAEIIPGRFIDS